MDTIEQDVKGYIMRECLPGADAAELSDTTPLIAGGIVDSLATIKLVAFLEERYGITIQPHEASVDYLDTIALIADLVRRKRGGAG